MTTRQQVNPALTYDHEAYRLGQREFDDLGNEYMFVRVTSTFGVTAGMVAAIAENFITQRGAAANGEDGDRVGVAMSTLDGDPGIDQYGWVSIYGTGMVLATSATVHNTHLYTSAGGRVGDVTTNQERLHHIYLTATRGGSNGPAPAVWYYPRF